MPFRIKFIDIQFKEAADGYELKVGDTAVAIALPKTDNAGVVEESIYTPLGIKETGTDNAEYIVSLTGDAAKVNEDKSYVVSYGVTGTLVDYTIIYQTNTGTVLGRSNYKGRVGDKPVVAGQDVLVDDDHVGTGILTGIARAGFGIQVDVFSLEGIDRCPGF